MKPIRYSTNPLPSAQAYQVGGVTDATFSKMCNQLNYDHPRTAEVLSLDDVQDLAKRIDKHAIDKANKYMEQFRGK